MPGREIDFAVSCSAFQIYVLGKEIAEYVEGLRHQHRRLRRAKVIVDNSQIPVKFEVGVDIEGEGTGDITVLGLAYVKRGSGFFLVRLFEMTAQELAEKHELEDLPYVPWLE